MVVKPTKGEIYGGFTAYMRQGTNVLQLVLLYIVKLSISHKQTAKANLAHAQRFKMCACTVRNYPNGELHAGGDGKLIFNK